MKDTMDMGTVMGHLIRVSHGNAGVSLAQQTVVSSSLWQKYFNQLTLIYFSRTKAIPVDS
jgi:hypothetical protein